MLNNFSSKCIKMAKRCAFGTSYGITLFNSGIKVRPSLGKACTNLCHVFGFVISTPGQGQQLLSSLLKKIVRRSTSSKGVKEKSERAVDSHIQRIVLTTEETTVTQQVSQHRPIKCQSRLWSRRGTKVNGSHHGDNPLLRPTGIQIATKIYAALQALAPTNIKTVHQTSLLHIESNLDRLGMLSHTHDQRSQQKTGKSRSNQF